MAEVEEAGPEEEAAQKEDTIPSSASSFRPINPAARTHKDSGREVTELEPIDEQSERLESASLDVSTNLDEDPDEPENPPKADDAPPQR